MFSKLPMPQIEWNERNMRYMLCAFPLVGAVTGALVCLWTWVCTLIGAGAVLFAAGLAVIPIAVTGGIHLDGFCDTADALASNAPPERKREILKDPHSGAFAVISVCAYVLAYFAIATEIEMSLQAVLLMALAHVLSRVMSGLCAICYPASGSKGLLDTFRGSAAKKRAAIVLFIEYAVVAAAMIWLGDFAGFGMIIAGLAVMLWLRIMSARQFGGMSGDLSGWFLQMAELAMLTVLAAFCLLGGGIIR